ncbi:MAG: MBL fold metallo-hydrolase [Alphaproteobacteria bacterium]
MAPSAAAVKARAALTFPFETAPEPGETLEVAPGILWFRLPLPFALNHINVWLIDDGEGWAVVDTGIDTAGVREMWDGVLKRVLGGRPVTRVIVTHLHPDHVGLAGWLVRRFDVPFHMSRTEYAMCRMLVADTGKDAPEEGIRFYRAAGFSEVQLEAYSQRFGGFGRRVSALPESFIRMRDGDRLVIGGRTWHLIAGGGHSPEHISLHCPELDLYISGDQVLPSISSNISVWPTEPLSDPLSDWLEACRRIPTLVPQTVLVCPAHQKAFHGLHERCAALVAEHEEGLSKLLDMLGEPRRAVDVFTALFRREITGELVGMATGEALAHLNCLKDRGALSVERDGSGVDWYRRR